jgi:hypothetical protein
MQIAIKMRKQILLILSTILFIASCSNNKAPNVDHIKVNLQPVRYDKLLYAVDTNAVKQGLMALSVAHPYFTEVYTEHLTGWGRVSDTASMVFNAFHHFLSYKDYVNLQKTINVKFADTKKIDAELTQLFQYIKYYFPKYTIPKLYYFNSGLNVYSAITYDTLVGVGLDMYLGKDFEFYPSIQLPAYQIAQCSPEYIAPNMASSVYQGMLPFSNAGKTLLDMMIQRGKELYFLDKVLPNTDDAFKIGYSAPQIKWCIDNELMIWNLFKQNNLLYETSLHKTMPFILDGPNTQGLPLECPGNAGSWIGWQIVKKYCEKNPPASLQAFCNAPIDAQAILQGSGYKGR